LPQLLFKRRLLRRVVAEPAVVLAAPAGLELARGLEQAQAQAVRVLAAVAQVAAETPPIPNEAGKALPAPLARATKPHHVRMAQPELDGKS